MNRTFHVHGDNLKALLKHNYAEQPFFQVSGEILDYGFDAEPIEDYELPANFPHCCSYHSEILANVKDWFDRFPFCCAGHEELVLKDWFDKSIYDGMPEKISTAHAHTCSHIEAKIDTDNWYKDITDYIEYMIASFGSPSIGCERYMAHLANYIENGKLSFWTPIKRQRLMEYINQLNNLASKSGDKSKFDLNILYSTFQKWLKILPDIFFKEFKEGLINKVPINLIIYDSVYNPYLGVSKSKARTKGELVELLMGFTRDLLASINTEELIAKKIILDVDKHEFNLISEEHKISQINLLGKYSKGESAYVSIVKTWLNNELSYFSKIKSYINLGLKSSNKLRKEADSKIKILFLTSNPIDSTPLRLEDELRKVKDEIQQSSKRELLELISESAVKVLTITRALQQQKPRIVHFSGHGSGEGGLVVQDDSGEAILFPSIGLDRLFKLHKSNVKCVLLNACYSKAQAQIISKHNIYVIGMNNAVGDRAALDFAVGFYQSIGEGKSYKYAFENALISISPSLDNANTPELWYKGQIVT